MGGSYNKVAETEKLRQEKGIGRVDFEPVIYGEEKRCTNCWSLLSQREDAKGNVTKYCFTCYAAVIK